MSSLLHGGMLHLAANLYFLMVFGGNVETWLGRKRYLLLLMLAVIAGAAAQIAADPVSTIPVIGFSGGVSGVITLYALQFPRAQLGLLCPCGQFSFFWVRLPAWALFCVWTALQLYGAHQQLPGFSQVSSLAQLGGASVGFMFWLLRRKEVGGPSAAVSDRQNVV